MRKKKRTALLWPTLLAVTIILSLLGLFFVFESSTAESYIKYSHQYHFIKAQGISFLLGFVALIAAFCTPMWIWKKISIVLFFASILLLLSVFIPGVGIELNGAQRWILINGRSFQPIEFMKLSMVLFFANYLSKKVNIKSFLFFTSLISVILLLQPDMGSLLIVIWIAFGMFFVAGGSISEMLLTCCAGGIILLLLVLTSSYRMRRLKTFFNPEQDLLGASFHIQQIKLALGNGGLIGQGIGNSKQKLLYIPEASSDSIFAIMAEEIGFVGSLFILFLYSLYFYVAYQIARKLPPGSFNQLVAYGILLWISGQTFINLGAIVSLIPLTGLPLPFFSYGGSSLITVLFGSGILARLAYRASSGSK